MFVALLGLSSTFVEGSLVSLNEQMSRDGLQVSYGEAESLDALARIALQQPPPLVCRIPHVDDGLTRILGDPSFLPIYLHSDPVEFVHEATSRGGSPQDHTRDVMRRLASLASVVTSGIPRLDLSSPHAGRQLIELVRTYISSGPRPAETAPVGHAVSALQTTQSLKHASRTEEADLMIEGAVAGFRLLLAGEEPRRFVISRQLFLNTDEGGKPHTGPIDVTGRARLLINGPYIYLPRGQWKVRTVVGVSPDLVGVPFTIDIATNQGQLVPARTTFAPQSSGIHEVLLEFSHENHAWSIEVRVLAERAIFDGRLTVGYATFDRLQPQPLNEGLAHEGMLNELGFSDSPG